MKKIILIISLIIISISSIKWTTCLLFGNEFKIIMNCDNERIEVTANPKRIACLHGPAYDRILMMDKASRLTLMPLKATPWALKLFPEIKDIPIVTSYIELDIEQMLKYKIDLVFYSMYHTHANQLKNAGFSAVRPFSVKKMPVNMNEFMTSYKRQIKFFGEVIGVDACVRAKKYCEYFDNTFKKILSITSAIPKKKKPKVYYGCMNGSLYETQGGDGIMRWCVEAAGGNFVTAGFKMYFAKVSTEQLIAWNPEFIFIGMKGSLEHVKDNTIFKGIKAVENGNIYMIPVGIFWWDLSSCETVLLPIFLAKKFHPELFKDWDLIKEMKKFYAEIYEKKLTTQDAERILQALPPI